MVSGELILKHKDKAERENLEETVFKASKPSSDTLPHKATPAKRPQTAAPPGDQMFKYLPASMRHILSPTTTQWECKLVFYILWKQYGGSSNSELPYDPTIPCLDISQIK